MKATENKMAVLDDCTVEELKAYVQYLAGVLETKMKHIEELELMIKEMTT